MVVKPHPNQMGCQITKCWMLEFPVLQWHKEAEKSPWQKKLARETVLIFFIGIIVFFFLEMLHMHTNAICFLRILRVNFALSGEVSTTNTLFGCEESREGRKGGERKTVWPFSKTSVIRPAILSAHMPSFTRFRRLLLLIIFIFLNPRAGRQIDSTAFEKQITVAKDLDGKVVLVTWPQRLNASLSQHQAASCIYAVLLIILILLFPFTWYQNSMMFSWNSTATSKYHGAKHANHLMFIDFR